MNNPSEDPSSSSPSLVRKIDRVCDEFEEAWQAGSAPRIEEYLVRCVESERPRLFRELLGLEIDLRREAGEIAVAAEYDQRFPEHRETVQSVLSTAPAETITFHVGSTDGSPRSGEAPQFVPGSKFGRFELIEQVGQGAFGTVYRASDPELDREVAIKIPRKGQLNTEESDNFLREARAAGQLKHANIVRIYDTGFHDGQVYIVSDFIRGQTLANRLTTTPYGSRQAAELCSQVADALHHAHQAGVIHRDLKPSNIMLDDNGQPHVMDFGLAKRESGEMTRTVAGQLLGTPAYMSPEQAQGSAHVADRRSDVYALGVILFELLTGERPFRGKRQMLLHQVINEDAPGPQIEQKRTA